MHAICLRFSMYEQTHADSIMTLTATPPAVPFIRGAQKHAQVGRTGAEGLCKKEPAGLQSQVSQQQHTVASMRAPGTGRNSSGPRVATGTLTGAKSKKGGHRVQIAPPPLETPDDLDGSNATPPESPLGALFGKHSALDVDPLKREDGIPVTSTARLPRDMRPPPASRLLQDIPAVPARRNLFSKR